MTPGKAELPDATRLAVDRTRLAYERTLMAWDADGHVAHLFRLYYL